MKAIKFLLGVMLGISTLSYSQGTNDPYPPINRVTILNGETISQTHASVDSMAPATDPVSDSVTASAVTADSALASVDSATSIVVENKMADTKSHESEISISQRWGLNGTLGAWILGILGFGIVMLFRTNAAKSFGGTIKNWITPEDSETKAERKARIIAIKVNSKAEAITKLGDACGKAETAVGKEKIKWTDSKDLRNFIDWMLEGKRFLRWNWNLIMGSILGLLLIGTLTLFALNQPQKIVINNEIPVLSTPTVVVVPDPEQIQEINYDDHSVASHTPQGEVHQMVFDVPGEDSSGYKLITSDWFLPYNVDGWNYKVTWTGNPVWYPEVDKFEQYIDMRKGQQVDIGAHNPEKMNYSFQSLDGQPAQVIVQYWSKVGV